MRMAPRRAPSQLTAPLRHAHPFRGSLGDPAGPSRLSAHHQNSLSPLPTRGQFEFRRNRYVCGIRDASPMEGTATATRKPAQRYQALPPARFAQEAFAQEDLHKKLCIVVFPDRFEIMTV